MTDSPDCLHVALNLCPLLAPGLLRRQANSHKHLVSSVHSPHRLKSPHMVSEALTTLMNMSRSGTLSYLYIFDWLRFLTNSYKFTAHVTWGPTAMLLILPRPGDQEEPWPWLPWPVPSLYTTWQHQQYIKGIYTASSSSPRAPEQKEESIALFIGVPLCFKL